MSGGAVFLSSEAGGRCGALRPMLLSFVDWSGGYFPVGEPALAACSAYQAYCAAYSAFLRSDGGDDDLGHGCGGVAGVSRNADDAGCVSPSVGREDLRGSRLDEREGIAEGVGLSASVVEQSRSSVVDVDATDVSGDASVRDYRGQCVASVGVRGDGSCGYGRTVGVVVAGGRCLPRGPNFARNNANRLRKREQALAKKAEYLQLMERTVAAAGTRVVESRASGSWRITEEERELRKLKVERQIIQERRRIDKLKSPVQMVEDAMEQIAFAERCARLANDSKVAAWAADLSSASAESIARSAGADIRTVSSGSVGKQVSGVVSVGRDGAAVVSSSAVSTAGVRGSVKPALRGFTLEQLTSGISDRGSVSSSGVLYNKHTAASWVKGYNYLEKYSGHSDQQVAKLAAVSVGEVKKYHRLKAEFGL